MPTSIFDTYQTDGSANQIFLNIQIGFAQLGSTAVSVDGVPIVITPPADAAGNYRNDFTIPLDTNAALAGRVLQIISNVNIIQPPGNSSVAINLSGGTAPQQYLLDSTGAAVGDVVNYFASITFL